MTAITKPLRVLMVDDDPSDVHLASLVLDDLGTPLEFHSCASVDEGLDFVHRRGPHADAPAPDYILLDLNMPGRDGFEFLDELADHTHMQQNVIVLTTSARASDIARAYSLGAGLVLTKPVDLDDYHMVMQDIETYWQSQPAVPSA